MEDTVWCVINRRRSEQDSCDSMLLMNHVQRLQAKRDLAAKRLTRLVTTSEVVDVAV